jgi:hypothetical protein
LEEEQHNFKKKEEEVRSKMEMENNMALKTIESEKAMLEGAKKQLEELKIQLKRQEELDQLRIEQERKTMEEADRIRKEELQKMKQEREQIEVIKLL